MQQTRPRVGHFWFISSPDSHQQPSRMVARFVEASGAHAASAEGEEVRYQSSGMYADEEWPVIQAAFPSVGWRDHTYFPSGTVSWNEAEQSALYLIDPALNSGPFLAEIARQSRTSLARAKIKVSAGKPAIAKVGLPEFEPDYDAQTSAQWTELDTGDLELATPSTVLPERAHGALLGLAIGDALGAPLEFSARDTLPPVMDLIGGGPFHLRPGEWTDDTSMALCLADSLIAQGGLSERDLLERFVRWWEMGENSVTGSCFDIGNATRQALERFKRLRSPAGSGPREKYHAGNGSLMRLAPVAIFAAPDAAEAMRLADLQSEATHANDLAQDACRLLAALLVEAMAGFDKDYVLRSRFWLGLPEIADIAAGHWSGKSRDQISSSGYVVDTLEAAIWCVAKTKTFEEALVLAVNLADDSDTVGAVTGQLAGALYGRDGIPKRWLQRLAWLEHIEERAAALLGAGASARTSKGAR